MNTPHVSSPATTSLDNEIATSDLNVWFQKISAPPPWRELCILDGWGQMPRKMQSGGGFSGLKKPRVGGCKGVGHSEIDI